MQHMSDMEYNDFAENITLWVCLYSMQGMNVEQEVYTCPSCEQTMTKKELLVWHKCKKYVNEKFRIGKIINNLKMTSTEKALVAAISILSTGK